MTPGAASPGLEPELTHSGQHVLAIGAQKGGVGKTTTAVYTAHHARLAGLRVALVDRDESHILTELLAFRPELLASGAVLWPGRDLPPASAGFDLVIIDTPPGLSALQSLREAHYLLIPAVPEDQGVLNLMLYLKLLDTQRIYVNPRLHLVAILPTKVQIRTVYHRERLADIATIASRQEPPLRVLPAIPLRIQIAACEMSAPEYVAPIEEVFRAAGFPHATRVGS